LCDLLKEDPSQRLSNPAQIQSHPYFSGHNWNSFDVVDPPIKPELEEMSSFSRMQLFVNTTSLSAPIMTLNAYPPSPTLLAPDHRDELAGYTIVGTPTGM